MHSPSVRFEEISSLLNRKKILNHAEVDSMLRELTAAAEEDDHLVNLADYVSASAVSLQRDFSLMRTHIIFRYVNVFSLEENMRIRQLGWPNG